MKKILVAMLSLTLVASLVTGCAGTSTPPASVSGSTEAASGSTSTSTPTPTDGSLPTLTIAVGKDSRALPPAEMLFESKYNTELGVNVQYTAIPGESVTEKKNLMLASNDLPDVFMGMVDRNDVMRYKDQGIFIPVNDLIDQHMPLLQGIFEKRPNYKKEATAPDGNIYGFPYIEEMNGLILNQGILSINKTWLDKLNLKMPTTVQEYKDVLIAFRDGDPNGNGQKDEVMFTAEGKASNTGIGNWAVSNFLTQLVGCFGEPTRGDYLAVKDGKIYSTATSDSVREAYKFFHEMYKEGLIDPEIFNNDRGMYDAKLRTDPGIVGSTSTFSIADHASPQRRTDFVAVPYLTGPGGEMGQRENFSEMRPTAFVITKACKDPALAARYADGLYEPTTSVAANWGPLDYVYKFDDKGQMVWDTLKDDLDNFDDMRARHTLGGNHPLAILNEYYGTVVEYPQNAMDLYKDMETVGFVSKHLNDEYIPPLWYDVQQTERMSIINTQLYGYIDTTLRGWMMDGGIDEGWDAYVKQVEALGMGELVGIVQSAYDKMK